MIYQVFLNNGVNPIVFHDENSAKKFVTELYDEAYIVISKKFVAQTCIIKLCYY